MDLLGLMEAAIDFLERMIEFCEEYGLGLDQEGLIVEEYEREIPRTLSAGLRLSIWPRDFLAKPGRFEHKNPRGWTN